MGTSYGYKARPESFGRGVGLSANGAPIVKAGGITVAWETVAAVSGSAVTLPGGIVVDVGKKYLATGQPMVRMTSGTYSGLWGPYDNGATDGRQTVTAARRGDVVLIDFPILEDDDNSNHPPGVIEGGLIFRDRLKVHATTGSLANGPAIADLLAALPQLRFAQD